MVRSDSAHYLPDLALINLGLSALAGFALLVFAMPIQAYGVKCLFSLRMESRLWTDKRSKLLQELLSGIRVIKFFSWEVPFLKRISEYRRSEMAYVNGILSSCTRLITVLHSDISGASPSPLQHLYLL
jgi:hypothetical protein